MDKQTVLQVRYNNIYLGKCVISIVLCIVLVNSALFYGYGTIPDILTKVNIRSFFHNDLLTVINCTKYARNFSCSSTPPQLNRRQEEFRRNHFMTVYENGRLGNVMFEVASLICIANQQNYTAFISRNNLLNKYFALKLVEDIHMINVGIAAESKAGVYDTNIKKLSHDKNWTLSGYFQSWKYFHHCKQEIMSCFQFKPNTKNQALEVLEKINAKGRTLVGIHVRRSDMRFGLNSRMGYNVATPEYIKKALNYFRNVTKKPLFLAVSDDRRWTTQHAKGNDVIFVGSNKSEVDLAILTLCNHTIITSGSFGWWGAYLNDGKTVYFSNYPKRNSWLSTQFKLGDYYLPKWIGMK